MSYKKQDSVKIIQITQKGKDTVGLGDDGEMYILLYDPYFSKNYWSSLT